MLNFLLAQMGPWLAMKLLKPEVIAKIILDLAMHFAKKTETKDDDEFISDLKKFLGFSRK